MNDFDGMDKEEFQWLALQAQLLHLTVKTAVLQAAMLQLFKQTGVTTLEGKPIADYIPEKIREMMPTYLATASDHDPNLATKLAKMIEAIERGHV